MQSLKTKILQVKLNVSTSVKPWSKKQMKLKKKHRKPQKQTSSVNIDLTIELVDRLRLSENVLIPNLGQFRVVSKDAVSNKIELRSLQMNMLNISGFVIESNMEVEVAPLSFCVGESSHNSSDPRLP